MAGIHSPPKLGGDALAQRGLGRSVQRRTVPINRKERFAGIHKEPLRGTLNRPPRRFAAPLLCRDSSSPISEFLFNNKHRSLQEDCRERFIRGDPLAAEVSLLIPKPALLLETEGPALGCFEFESY